MKFLLVSQYPGGRDEGAAARVAGLDWGLRQLGHEVDRLTLEPDTRLRRRRPRRPWWWFHVTHSWRREFICRAASADVLIASYLPVAYECARLVDVLPRRLGVVYDAHNAEERLAAQMGSHRARAIGAMEAATIETFGTIWVAGSLDTEVLSKRYPTAHFIDVPNGVGDLPLLTPPPDTGPGAFSYGSWGYAPNALGLRALASARTARSGAVNIFGRSSRQLAASVRRRARRAQPALDWRFHGFEPSFQRMVDIAGGPAVIPIWRGGGTKLRTVEIAAMGVPIYATPEAVSGLPEWIGEGIALEQDPERLIERALGPRNGEWDRARDLATAVRDSLNWPRLIEHALSQTEAV